MMSGIRHGRSSAFATFAAQEASLEWSASMGTVKTNTFSDIAAWHAMSEAEVVTRLNTSAENGLDLSDASARLQEYGANRLPECRKRTLLAKFFAHFNNVLIYVLLAAGFTKLMMSEWIDAGIIFAVVVLNALLGFIQEGKAEK